MVLMALGTIMRSRKRYAEAVDYYKRAIDLVQRLRGHTLDDDVAEPLDARW